MKKLLKPSLKYLLAALMTLSLAAPLATAQDQISTEKPSKKLHARDDDRTEVRRADTIKVVVTEHYEYQDGKYVLVPTHYADAPRPTDAEGKVFWVPPGYVREKSGYQPGHWSMIEGIEATPVK